jgi:hypothetical protein
MLLWADMCICRWANTYYPPSVRPGKALALSGMYQAHSFKNVCRGYAVTYSQSVNLTVRHGTVPTRQAANGRIQSWCESDIAAVLLLCVCYDLCSKCTKIPGLNGKERAGTSVYYMTGNTGRWRVVLVYQTVWKWAVGCARGGHKVIRDWQCGFGVAFVLAVLNFQVRLPASCVSITLSFVKLRQSAVTCRGMTLDVP